jgi:hypothetical protein
MEWNANMQLMSYWNIWTGGGLTSSSLNQSILRGGPMMKIPGSIRGRIGFSTDSRKKLVFDVYVNKSLGFEDYSNNLYTSLNISYKPTNYLVITLNPSISKSFSELQYITKNTVENADKYIFGSIDRKTISTSFRVNLNLSPDLTLQYWGQPFIASGLYYDHKYITDPMADNYHDRFHTYTENEIILDGDQYNVDENADGITDYSFDKEDFNIQEFLSNLVIRWEYSPGSSVYLVWSQTRSSSNNSGTMDYLEDMGDLFDSDNNKPHNVFLIKFSYRFGLK